MFAFLETFPNVLCFSSLSTPYIKSSNNCLAGEVMNIGDMMCTRKYDHDMGRVANFLFLLNQQVSLV